MTYGCFPYFSAEVFQMVSPLTQQVSRIAGRYPALIAFGVLVLGSSAWATNYSVGPGMPLARISDVPWESLNAGDTVFIYARPAPYAEKWILKRSGTQASPITVRGVP